LPNDPIPGFSFVNWSISLYENGNNSYRIWRPVKRVPNSLLSNDALEPVMKTFFFLSRRLRTNFS
jgi:hypothetical protein